MKANEFVKKYGWDAAMDLWCGAFDLYNNDLQILNGVVCRFSDNKFLFDLGDIKRLVESYSLVEKHGGLFQSKVQLDKFGFSGGLEWYGEDGEYGLTDDNDLRRAIADVESCL